MGLIPEGHAREHTQVDQAGLLRTAHQIHLEAKLLLDRLKKIAAVRRFPHGTGGSSHHIAGLHTVAGSKLAAMAQGGEGPLDRIRGEIAGVRIPLPQARGGFLRENHRKRAQFRVHRCHQQVNGIGADVDPRHGADGAPDGAVGGLAHAAIASRAAPLSHCCTPAAQP